MTIKVRPFMKKRRKKRKKSSIVPVLSTRCQCPCPWSSWSHQRGFKNLNTPQHQSLLHSGQEVSECVRVPLWQLLSFLQTPKHFLGVILVQVRLCSFIWFICHFRSYFIRFCVFSDYLTLLVGLHTSTQARMTSRNKVRGPTKQGGFRDVWSTPPPACLPPAPPSPSSTSIH